MNSQKFVCRGFSEVGLPLYGVLGSSHSGRSVRSFEAAAPPSCSYSPKCVEGEFSEVKNRVVDIIRSGHELLRGKGGGRGIGTPAFPALRAAEEPECGRLASPSYSGFCLLCSFGGVAVHSGVEVATRGLDSLSFTRLRPTLSGARPAKVRVDCSPTVTPFGCASLRRVAVHSGVEVATRGLDNLCVTRLRSTLNGARPVILLRVDCSPTVTPFGRKSRHSGSHHHRCHD
jgi:hypothetical protein